MLAGLWHRVLSRTMPAGSTAYRQPISKDAIKTPLTAAIGAVGNTTVVDWVYGRGAPGASAVITANATNVTAGAAVAVDSAASTCPGGNCTSSWLVSCGKRTMAVLGVWPWRRPSKSRGACCAAGGVYLAARAPAHAWAHTWIQTVPTPHHLWHCPCRPARSCAAPMGPSAARPEPPLRSAQAALVRTRTSLST